MNKQPQRLYRLGRCTIDALDGSVDGPHGRYRVDPDAMQVLMCLMRQPGKVVGRDEISREVWAGRDVEPGALDTHIGELRRALGDDGAGSGYIRTVAQRGYRLVAQVDEVAGAGEADVGGSAPTLWSELKRRKVVRTALGYIAVSWIVLQVVDTVTPPLPEQLRPAILAIIMLGLPFAVILAWAYDVVLIRDRRSDFVHRTSEYLVANVNKLLLTGSVLAAAVGVAVILQTRQVLSFSPGGTVVLSFENHTGDDALGLALGQAFRIALEQSRHASVISRQRVNEVLARMHVDSYGSIDRDTAQEVAIREGAQAVVVGSVSRIGDAYSIFGEVINPANGSVVYSTSGRAGNAGLLEVVEDIADDLRENLGETLTSIAETSQPLEKVATPNLDALRAFSLGREKKWRLESQEAIDLMREAIKLDPEFAFAHVELGALLYSKYTDKRPAYEQWQKALSFEDRLTQRDKLLIEALLAMQGSPDEELRRLTLLTNLYPNYATGYRMTGRVYWRMKNDFRSAAASFARAAESDDIWLSYSDLAYCQLGLGEFDKAIAAFRKAHEQSGHYYKYGLADAYIAAEKYTLAQQLLAPFVEGRVSGEHEDAYTRLLGYLIDRGQFAQAESRLAQLRQLPDRSDPLISLADDMIHLALLRFGPDRPSYLQVLDAMAGELELAWAFATQAGMPAPVSETALLGKLAVRAGRLEFAQTTYDFLARRDDMAQYPIHRALVRVLEAELLIAGGSVEQAIAVLRDTLAPTHLYQAHETLAYAFEVDGQTESAIAELQWLIAHRGQAFAEYLPNLFGREHNIVDSSVAHYRLGQAYERLGQKRAAGRHYEKLMTRWQDADNGIEVRTLADQRLAALYAGG